MITKQRNKYIAGLIPVICAFILMGNVAYAAGEVKVVETNAGEEDITVYVKGNVADAEQVAVQIGTAVCDTYEVNRLSENAVPIQTLVMVDNSLSIPKQDRGKIAEVLQNLISDRLPGEEVSIATFSESIHYLTEYTNDYTVLKAATESIEYLDQETYLTDVLYDVLTDDFIGKPFESFRRILIISDGVDNKSIGYTKEELYALLRDYAIPIYTIGCETGKNNEQLENMFALSRMTTADYFDLAEVESLLDINESLKTDRDILEVKISPAAEMLDGTKKAVKLTFGKEASGGSVSSEIEFPQKAGEVVEEKEPEKSPKPTVAPTEQVQEPPIEPEQTQSTKGLIWAVILVPFLLVIAAVVAVVLIIRKRNDKKNEFESITTDALQELDNQLYSEANEKTEIIINDHKSDGHTQLLWDSPATCQVILTDVHSPAKSFQSSIKGSVIIGRRRDLCNLVIDYDKSVSGKHCEIKERNGKFYISDPSWSSNGTFVNGSRVVSEVEIFSGNVIKLGRLEFKFEAR